MQARDILRAQETNTIPENESIRSQLLTIGSMHGQTSHLTGEYVAIGFLGSLNGRSDRFAKTRLVAGAFMISFSGVWVKICHVQLVKDF